VRGGAGWQGCKLASAASQQAGGRQRTAVSSPQAASSTHLYPHHGVMSAINAESICCCHQIFQGEPSVAPGGERFPRPQLQCMAAACQSLCYRRH
jgi:hypothetical protein